MYTCRSEYAVKKEEKEERERIAREVTKRDIKYKDYDGAMMSDRLWLAGKASYVERNQDVINASDYCVFYYKNVNSATDVENNLFDKLHPKAFRLWGVISSAEFNLQIY